MPPAIHVIYPILHNMNYKERRKQVEDKFFRVKEAIEQIKMKKVELTTELHKLKGQHELLIELEKENGTA